MKRGSVVNRWLDRYVGIAALKAISCFNRRQGLPSVFRTIGLLASPTIGDTLLTSGAVLDLRTAFPEARLIYFTPSGPPRSAVDLIPGIDDIQLIDLLQPALTVKAMRKCDLDLIVDFTQWQRITALYCGLSGARYRLGFSSSGQHRHYLYDESVLHSANAHETENFSSLVRALGVRATCLPRLNVPAQRLSGANTSIIFHPWATGDRAFLREWDTRNWVEVAKKLAGNETVFEVTGSRLDLPKSEDLVRRLRSNGLRARTFSDSGGLLGLCHQLQQSELTISVNTGIMHLSALLGTPTVSLNGPTSAHRWGPVGPKTRSVGPRGGGGGFLHFGFEFSGNAEDTMRRILVDDVFAAAQDLVPRLQRVLVAQV